MTEIYHGFLFGIGTITALFIYMLIDKFTSDLNWKFWQWKRKNKK